VLVFAWPELSLTARGVPASYPMVTILFTCLVSAIVVSWPHLVAARPLAIARPWNSVPSIATAALAATMIAVALYRWTRLMAWQPYGADMLIVIREATRRFLNGHSPYTIYRSYDTTWQMAMPYGPALWGPFVVPQLLHLDFRTVTIGGELFVPVWCAFAAVVSASRRRAADAIAWLALGAALVLALDVQQFTLIGHTPAYWPLIPLFAAMTSRSRPVAAGCLLGVLVAARPTMVAVVPVFLMWVWQADRRRLPAVLMALTGAAAVMLVPFVAWDARGVWDSMVLSYPRVMKAAVWPVLARPGQETIGLTEWLLEHHHESLVMPVQAIAMLAVYAAAWFALARRQRALPWMALALFAFSMTTLYPVHYLYYDVLLLLISAAIADALDPAPLGVELAAWGLSLAIVAAIVPIALRVVARPFPHLSAGAFAADRPLRSGFAATEHDGTREFAWAVGNEARIVVPRSSATAADIVLTAESPFERDQPPQRMTAILNGALLGEATIPSGWQEIRIAAPSSAWWIGFNELRLLFSATVSPRDVGSGDDARPLALAVSRVDVVERR